jgi:HPr kinase/phosphorylase
MVFGQAAALLRHHIEVRGLGILNIKDLFGVTAIRERKRLDLIVRLELYDGEGSYDRIGLDDHHHELLGVPIREVVLPVQPGRDMTSIIEIAARNELLRLAGHNSARDFVQRIETRLIQREDTPSVRAMRVARRVSPNESSAPPPVIPERRR